MGILTMLLTTEAWKSFSQHWHAFFLMHAKAEAAKTIGMRVQFGFAWRAGRTTVAEHFLPFLLVLIRVHSWFNAFLVTANSCAAPSEFDYLHVLLRLPFHAFFRDADAVLPPQAKIVVVEEGVDLEGHVFLERVGGR